MRTPRDLSGTDLLQRLRRETGSHIRLTPVIRGEHHITVPNHDPLRQLLD